MPFRSPRHRHRHRHRAGGPLDAIVGNRRGQLVLVLAIVLVAVLAAATIALVTRPERADRSSAGGTTPAPDSAPATDTGAAGRTGAPAAAALLDWADRELPPRTQLRAEGDVRDDLLAAGAPDDLVATDRPTGPDDLVLTVTDRSAEPGGRVIARFDGLALRDPAPGTPTVDQLDRRRSLAGAILANPTTRAPEQAAEVLRSADVDMRLLSLLAVLTARQGLGVAAFPRAEGAEGPARSVLLDAVGNAPVGAGEAATAELRTWLEAQLPPFAPDRVEVTDDGVLLSYHYASDPDALVAEASP
ncbi:hypothetical protein [Blastococcus xanthinilyticus]|uniref:Uncharacterized protein n=1 Tax=Blastococcus xanthinilyticus TaxID=1564164 RepID=A0A5S5CQQ0_9ACTN|nr:hypothetical protein [Blastococcus xanthinilyticus]TYP85915.1 hypothetical protein BD833_11156 [Blastococcus xanthinilyticus]